MYLHGMHIYVHYCAGIYTLGCAIWQLWETVDKSILLLEHFALNMLLFGLITKIYFMQKVLGVKLTYLKFPKVAKLRNLM